MCKVSVFDMDWYKERQKAASPGASLMFYRKLFKYTQDKTANPAGVSKKAIQDMEKNKLPISPELAEVFAEIFKDRQRFLVRLPLNSRISAPPLAWA